MRPRADSATLNVQPRQRRVVYEGLANQPAGRSVKDLLGDLAIPESELRETLRKLDEAGLARRVRGTWTAVPLEVAEPGPRSASGAETAGSGDASGG
jgi:predicted ArsR family transcriptional regulator